MAELFANGGVELPDAGAQPVTSKSGFAEMLGLSKARISQLVEMGLPLTPGGKVPVAEGLAWYHRTVSPTRRKGSAEGEPVGAKARLAAIRADQAQLDLERARGELIPRKLAEAVLFERARAERDAHLAWIARTAPVLAAELGCEPGALFASMDRLFRLHLAELAATPIGDLSR